MLDRLNHQQKFQQPQSLAAFPVFRPKSSKSCCQESSRIMVDLKRRKKSEKEMQQRNRLSVELTCSLINWSHKTFPHWTQSDKLCHTSSKLKTVEGEEKEHENVNSPWTQKQQKLSLKMEWKHTSQFPSKWEEKSISISFNDVFRVSKNEEERQLISLLLRIFKACISPSIVDSPGSHHFAEVSAIHLRALKALHTEIKFNKQILQVRWRQRNDHKKNTTNALFFETRNWFCVQHILPHHSAVAVLCYSCTVPRFQLASRPSTPLLKQKDPSSQPAIFWLNKLNYLH